VGTDSYPTDKEDIVGNNNSGEANGKREENEGEITEGAEGIQSRGSEDPRRRDRSREMTLARVRRRKNAVNRGGGSKQRAQSYLSKSSSDLQEKRE